MDYQERQWFVQSPIAWVIVPIFLAALIVSISFGDALELKHLVAAVAIALMVSANLTTRVYENSISITYFPIVWRRIRFDDITSARLVPYNWQQFGGWGVRIGRRSVAYTMGGKTAVRLLLDGRDAMVGSKDAKSLLEALRQAGVEAVDTTDNTSQ